MTSTDSWQAGPWQLVSNGLASMGNKRSGGLECLDAQKSESIQVKLEEEETDFVSCLSSPCKAKRVIMQREVEQLLTLTDAGDEVWETIQVDDMIHVRRHRDPGLFGGCVFVKLSGHVANATAPQVAHCHMNFADRAGWDNQMDGFKVLHHTEGNDLLYCVIHAPPLSDRDFLMFHTVFRHESGRGLMFYSRSADDSLCPPNRAIRARQYVAAHQIMQDPDGRGVTFITTTAMDPQIPFLPRWIMSLLVPSEFRRWVHAVERRCKELHRDNIEVPCAPLFLPDFKLKSPVPPVPFVSTHTLQDVADVIAKESAKSDESTDSDPTGYVESDIASDNPLSLRVPLRPSAESPRMESSPGGSGVSYDGYDGYDGYEPGPILEDDAIVIRHPGSFWECGAPCHCAP